MSENTQISSNTYARIAGILYLIIIVCGITGEAFIRSNLIVRGDAAATVQNILASPRLFRTGFLVDSIMLLADVSIAVLFYVLLRAVSNTLALAAAAFRLTQAAVLGLNLLNYHAGLMLLGSTGYSASFETDQLNSLVMFFLDLHGHGYDLGLLFFGLSSIILGYLVVKSDYFPAILGYGLIAAAVVYLIGSYTRFLLPDYASIITWFYVVPFVAELSFCLWLMVKGVSISKE